MLRLLPILLAAAACLGCGPVSESAGEAAPSAWETLEPGLELGVFSAERPDGTEGRVRVLRIDPRHFELRLLNASAGNNPLPRTARQWCEKHGMVAAINASMYQKDFLTSTSLMRTRTHTNNARLTKNRCVLAFDPLEPDLPPVKMIDLECESFDEWKGRYGSFVQNIRMLSCKGKNVWSPQAKKWSTAAVGVDAEGRVLFVHARSAYTTHDLINALIRLPLQLRSLMYVEGGPEAQLYVSAQGREHEFVGSFESGFNENESNVQAWPVPNVIAVARREPVAE